MLELYHNAASTCSQKVRLALAHKGLAYDAHSVDLVGGEQHDANYVTLNPNHVVPTLIDGDHVLIESSLINEYLEDVYPTPGMLPTDPAARHACRLWVKHVDEKVHSNAGIITFAIGTRAALLQQPEAQREANINAIPDAARRAGRRSVIEHGVHAPEFAPALQAFVELADKLESALASITWLSGPGFGLADAAVLPYILRLDHLSMTPIIAARPNLQAWYDQVTALPAYQAAVTDWLAEPVVAMFRNNGAEAWPEVQQLLDANP